MLTWIPLAIAEFLVLSSNKMKSEDCRPYENGEKIRKPNTDTMITSLLLCNCVMVMFIVYN